MQNLLMTRSRLDETLVRRGLYPSRARASDAIGRGSVRVAGVVARKAGQPVAEDAEIAIDDEARRYVSRSALKLIHALDRFALSPHGQPALDIGASTGGFTEVLLERGARHVTAIDVGHGQLTDDLRGDRRVTLIEKLNARHLASVHLAEPPEFIAVDVSFISLKLALPAALALAAPGAKLVALVKPQFEAGRDAVRKSGIVADARVHHMVCDDIAAWLTQKGWNVIGVVPSPIEGGDGNREFLIAASKPC